MAKPNHITQGRLDINPKDIAPLEERHRAAMLELILIWGTLDGAIGILLSKMKGLPYTVGADQFAELSTSKRFEEVRKMLATSSAPGTADAARLWRRRKKTYEKHSSIRNFIAHSHCPGIWKRHEDVILFAPFRHHRDNLMQLHLVPIQDMERAGRWGYELQKVLQSSGA
jgi:hypothetical protein